MSSIEILVLSIETAFVINCQRIGSIFMVFVL